MIRGLDLSLDPFRDLIEANRMDQRVTRYRELRRPRGLLHVVRGAGRPARAGRVRGLDAERIALSDKVCIGLQVVEHLQDIGEDAAAGPHLHAGRGHGSASGAREAELLGPSASPALRRLVAMEVSGPGTCSRRQCRSRRRSARVPGPRSWASRQAGSAALDSIERAGYDVLGHRCRPRKLRFARRALAGLVAASRGGGGL